jgi:hypothetical protein
MSPPVDDLDQQVALLVLQRGRHEQRQDLVKQRLGAKVPRLVRELAQRGLALGRGAVLDLEQQLEDLAPLLLLHAELRLVHVLEQHLELLRDGRDMVGGGGKEGGRLREYCKELEVVRRGLVA